MSTGRPSLPRPGSQTFEVFRALFGPLFVVVMFSVFSRSAASAFVSHLHSWALRRLLEALELLPARHKMKLTSSDPLLGRRIIGVLGPLGYVLGQFAISILQPFSLLEQDLARIRKSCTVTFSHRVSLFEMCCVVG